MAPQGPPPYRLPAAGSLVTGMGEVSEAGVRSRGLTLSTWAGAQIVTPAAGRVIYAGRFRGYGNIVILDHGDGWTSLVAGLDRLQVRVGDAPVQGSPLGHAPQGGIQHGIERAGGEQHGTEASQRCPCHRGVVMGQGDVQRQRHKGQRRRQAAIGQSRAPGQWCRAGVRRRVHGARIRSALAEQGSAQRRRDLAPKRHGRRGA